jgi:hypothetical protein
MKGINNPEQQKIIKIFGATLNYMANDNQDDRQAFGNI